MEFYFKPNYTLPYYRKTFEDASEFAVTFLAPLPEETVNRKPDSKTWSIAQCFDHLIETGYAYLEEALPVIDKYEDQIPMGRGPYHHRFFVEWFIKLMRPPSKFRFNAPDLFLPKSDLNKKRVLDGFVALQKDILFQIDRISELNMNKLKVPHPLVPFFKLNMSEVLAIIDAHQQRHFWQARHILQQVDRKESTVI